MFEPALDGGSGTDLPRLTLPRVLQSPPLLGYRGWGARNWEGRAEATGTGGDLLGPLFWGLDSGAFLKALSGRPFVKGLGSGGARKAGGGGRTQDVRGREAGVGLGEGGKGERGGRRHR